MPEEWPYQDFRNHPMKIAVPGCTYKYAASPISIREAAQRAFREGRITQKDLLYVRAQLQKDEKEKMRKAAADDVNLMPLEDSDADSADTITALFTRSTPTLPALVPALVGGASLRARSAEKHDDGSTVKGDGKTVGKRLYHTKRTISLDTSLSWTPLSADEGSADDFDKRKWWCVACSRTFGSPAHPRRRLFCRFCGAGPFCGADAVGHDAECEADFNLYICGFCLVCGELPCVCHAIDPRFAKGDERDEDIVNNYAALLVRKKEAAARKERDFVLHRSELRTGSSGSHDAAVRRPQVHWIRNHWSTGR